MISIACLRCDMGRWPSTSPVITKLAPVSSIRSAAPRNARMRQSKQGLRPRPKPKRGFFTAASSASELLTTCRGMPNSAAAARASDRHP